MERMCKLMKPESVAIVRRFLFLRIFYYIHAALQHIQTAVRKIFFRMPNCFVECLVYATINA